MLAFKYQRLIAMAVGCIASFMAMTTMAQSEDKEQGVFDSLYGSKFKRVRATTTRKDDLELAKELMAVSSDESVTDGLRLVIYEKVYDLSSRTPDGYDQAIEAMKRAAKASKKLAEKANQRIVELRRRQVGSTPRGEERQLANERYVVAMANYAIAQRDAGKEVPALTLLRQALSRAKLLKSDLVQKLTPMVDQWAAEQKLAGQIKSLQSRIQKNKDKAAALELMGLYIVQLDNPDEARKYTFLADEVWKKNVPLAAKKPTELTEAEAKDMADWYGALEQSAPPVFKKAMAIRQYQYFDRFLKLHEAKDLDRSRAALAHKMLGKRLADTGVDVASLVGEAATPSTPGSTKTPGLTPPVTTPDGPQGVKEGLVAHWQFEAIQNGMIKDSAMGKFPLRVLGVKLVEGRVGKAMRLEGAAQKVDVPAMGPSKAYTISMWIQPLRLEPVGSQRLLGLFMGDGFKQGSIHYQLKFNRPRLGTRGPFGMADYQVVNQPGGTPQIGKWQHIALTYSATDGPVHYLGGHPLKSGGPRSPATGKISVVPGPFQLGPGRLGGWNALGGNLPNRKFDVILDEVRIYNRALGSDEIVKLAGGKAPLPSFDASTVPVRPGTPSPVLKLEKVAAGTTVDLLKQIDTTRDAVNGRWTKGPGGLSGDATVGAGYTQLTGKIRVPFVARGSYELTVDFTRTAGQDDVYFMLTVGQAEAGVALSSYRYMATAGVAGLEVIKGVQARANPTTVRPFTMANKVRHRLVTKVAVAGTNASVATALDGKILFTWSGLQSDLRRRSPAWSFNGPSIGFGIYKSAFTVHSAKLKVINGEAGWVKNPGSPKPSGGGWTGGAGGPQGKGATVAETKTVLVGKTMDVLSLIDPTKHAIKSAWQKTPNGLTNRRQGGTNLIDTPVAPGNHYILAFSVMRQQGKDSANIVFPVGDRMSLMIIGGFPGMMQSGRVSGINNVDGKMASNNPSRSTAFQFQNNQTVNFELEVMVNGPNALIQLRQGKMIVVDWTGPVASLTPFASYVKLNKKTIGLGAHGSQVLYQKVLVKRLK